ncbi:MAG: tRNA threonylcarbamoyladenosine dehydratase, partial [Verrucomicrobia bacterium]
AARRKNPLAVRTGDIFDTFGCPLASRVRRGLRAAGVPRGAVTCAFSVEIPAEGSHVSCAGGGRKKVVGSTPVVTGTFGLVLADLAISAILGKLAGG